MVPINRRKKIESLLLDLGFAEKDIDLLTIAILYHLEGMGMLKIYQKISIERGGKSGRIEKLIHEAILRAWLQQTPMMRDMFFGYLIRQCPKNRITIKIISREIEKTEQRKTPKSAATDFGAGR